jgi:hypothetical protein
MGWVLGGGSGGGTVDALARSRASQILADAGDVIPSGGVTFHAGKMYENTSAGNITLPATLPADLATIAGIDPFAGSQPTTESTTFTWVNTDTPPANVESPTVAESVLWYDAHVGTGLTNDEEQSPGDTTKYTTPSGKVFIFQFSDGADGTARSELIESPGADSNSVTVFPTTPTDQQEAHLHHQPSEVLNGWYRRRETENDWIKGSNGQGLSTAVGKTDETMELDTHNIPFIKRTHADGTEFWQESSAGGTYYYTDANFPTSDWPQGLLSVIDGVDRGLKMAYAPDNVVHINNADTPTDGVIPGSSGAPPATITAAGTATLVDPTFTLASTSTPTTGQTLNLIRYTMTFTDPGFPNDGRIIVIEAASHAAAPTLASDTGGTPSARLTTGQLSGTGASVTFDAGPLNDIVLTGGGSIAVQLFVQDTGTNTGTGAL